MRSYVSLSGGSGFSRRAKVVRWLTLAALMILNLAGCTTKSSQSDLLRTPRSIALSADDAIIEVGGVATTINAILFDQNDEPLSDGYPVLFTIAGAPSMNGAGRPSFEYVSTEDSALLLIDILTDSTGKASVGLYSGTAPGIVRIRAASLDNADVFAEEHLVTIAIGGPASVVLSADNAIIEVGGVATTINAILFDQNDEPLSDGYPVLFTIAGAPSMNGAGRPSFEYVSTEDSALLSIDILTDSTGKASVELYSGTAPGPVRIRAAWLDNADVFAEEHLVTIAMGGPANVILGAEETAIEVGGENTIVFAVVGDEFGHNIGQGYGVRLEITDAPGAYGADRPSFEYPPSEDSVSHIYEAITDIDGRVETALFSGYVPGWVKIRATIIENENISVEELLVMIEPGPPAFVQISGGGPVQPIDDSLYITLGVGIWDQYANPTGFGIPVYLEIEPDSIVAFENIIYTDSNGWASTPLAYTCDHSLDTIQVIASAGSIADTSGLFPLPFYNGALYMTADPETIWIEPPDTVGFSTITVQLLDGLGCEISNGIICFAALVCGQISGQPRDTTDSDGYAYTEFMVHIDEIPGPPPDPPQCICVVRANLFGYPDIENQIEIICSRPR